MTWRLKTPTYPQPLPTWCPQRPTSDHLRLFKDRADFWSSLSADSTMMTTLVDGLIALFVRVYRSCQVGKDKYCKFQLEWHRECSLLLQDEHGKTSQVELCQLHSQWLKYCLDSGVNREVSVFDYLMLWTVKHQQKCDQKDQTVEDEEVGVYYWFGGAALSSMLHLRYNQLKADLQESSSVRKRVKTEITILKAIQTTDKTHIYEYLQYRDKGHMYFPAAWFIPFIRHVDLCVLEHVNAPSLQQHGPKLLPGSNGFGKKTSTLCRSSAGPIPYALLSF